MNSFFNLKSEVILSSFLNTDFTSLKTQYLVTIKVIIATLQPAPPTAVVKFFFTDLYRVKQCH